MKHSIMLVLVIAALVVIGPAAAKTKNPSPCQLPTGCGFTISMGPRVEVPADQVKQLADANVVPAGAEAPVAPSATSTAADASLAMGAPTQPMCAIDDNGNCVTDDGYYDLSDYDFCGCEGWRQPTTCWFQEVTGSWDYFPYDHSVLDDTFWCAKYAQYVTSRHTHVRLSSTLCEHSDAYSQRIGGGVGTRYIANKSSGSFSCGLPWIGGVHFANAMDVVHDYVGNAYAYAWYGE